MTAIYWRFHLNDNHFARRTRIGCPSDPQLSNCDRNCLTATLYLSPFRPTASNNHLPSNLRSNINARITISNTVKGECKWFDGGSRSADWPPLFRSSDATPGNSKISVWRHHQMYIHIHICMYECTYISQNRVRVLIWKCIKYEWRD